MKKSLGCFLFAAGALLGISAAVIRRIDVAKEFVEQNGLGRSSVFVMLIVAVALLGVGWLLLKNAGDTKKQ